jgi:hypothetical protein
VLFFPYENRLKNPIGKSKKVESKSIYPVHNHTLSWKGTGTKKVAGLNTTL